MYNAPYPARLAVSPMEQMEFNQLSVRHLANIFMRHSLLILVIVVVITGVTALSQMLVEPQYVARSTTKIEFSPADGGRGAAVPVAEKEMRMETQTKLMASRSLAEMVVRDLKLYNDPRFTLRPPIPPKRMTPSQLQNRITVTTRQLQGVTEVKRQPRTQLIEVAVATQDAELSARIADKFSVALQEWEENARAAERKNRIAYLKGKVSAVAADLTRAEQAVADFRNDNRMLVGAGTTMDLASINNIVGEAASARANRAASYARAGGIAAAGPGGAAFADSSPLLQQQQRQFDDLSRRKAELSVTYGPGYSEMQAIEAQMRTLRENMATESVRSRQAALAAATANASREAQLANSDASGAAARAAVLGGVLSELTAKAYRNAQGNVVLARLERDAQMLRDLYAEVRRDLGNAIASKGGTSITATVLAPASIPTEPVNVTPKKNITAALFGSLLLGFLVAFAKAMLDSRLYSANEVRRRFALPTLAMLPAIEPRLLANPADNPVIRYPRSLFAEASRSLFLELAKKPGKGGSKIVTVTSPLPGDGKSTAALSLAAAAMKQGVRSILIDLDLRRTSVLQEIQRNSDGPDLLEYLSNRQHVQKLLPRMFDPVESARASLNPIRDDDAVLPAILSMQDRVEDPGALISSRALDELLRDLRAQFDLIVLNAPPVLAVRDARSLSSIADETLMVVRWGSTKAEELAAAIEAMDDVPVGIVFNAVDYAEHARRRHSDAIQYFARASAYYDADDMPQVRRAGLLARLRAFRPFGRPAMA